MGQQSGGPEGTQHLLISLSAGSLLAIVLGTSLLLLQGTIHLPAGSLQGHCQTMVACSVCGTGQPACWFSAVPQARY